MPTHTTARLTAAMASVLTDRGIFQCTALVLPHTGLGLTPYYIDRTEPRADQERWTITHLSTGRAIVYPSAQNLRYNTARQLIRALVALPVDWRAEVPTESPEVIAEVKQLIREAQGGQ